MTALKQALLNAGVERPVLRLKKPRVAKSKKARPEPKKVPPKANAKPKPLWKKAKPGLTWLKATFPKAFDTPKPLRVGVLGELYGLKGDAVSGRQLHMALCWWTRQRAYQAALARGGHRYGLDGEPAGEVSPEEMEFARERLRGNGSRAQVKTGE